MKHEAASFININYFTRCQTGELQNTNKCGNIKVTPITDATILYTFTPVLEIRVDLSKENIIFTTNFAGPKNGKRSPFLLCLYVTC